MRGAVSNRWVSQAGCRYVSETQSHAAETHSPAPGLYLIDSSVFNEAVLGEFFGTIHALYQCGEVFETPTLGGRHPAGGPGGGKPMKAGQKKKLDPEQRSLESQEFEAALRQKIVGQDEGVQSLVDLYQVFCAGLNSPGRPVGNLLFLGPTGSGKTRIVEAAAEILFGDPRAVIKVDCAEFQHSHEIAKLIGSPPGYLGHRETHPLITQEALAQYHTERLKLSFLLFDEIEKASDALWQLLLGILDKATLTLGDNRRVDLSATMIFLTSNLGGGEITELMTGGMGFVQPADKGEDKLDSKVERT